MRSYRAALCQLDTGADKERNLNTAARLLREAKAGNADLALFPELFNLIDDGTAEPEDIPSGRTVTFMAERAREHGMWILCGSLAERDPNGGKRRNTSVLLSPQGEVAAKYSKLHMFDVDLPSGDADHESDLVQPGKEIVLAETELGGLGMSICYDLRFPELYRILALRGAQVLLIPAEFHARTGAKHWETLLRARAIENGCYVLAPDQVGLKPNGFPCYGNSLAVAPDGTVLARGSADREEVLFAEIDLDEVESARRTIPSLANRRTDLYRVNGL